MSRAERLLQLMQMLRRHRAPVSAAALAAELGISLRTTYRDIASLQAQGAAIDGEPGVGYVLQPGFVLPPMMFSAEEIEALVLGCRWVAERTDERLAQAAADALAKVGAVLPRELRRELETSALMVGPKLRKRGAGNAAEGIDTGDAYLPTIREAIRNERKLRLAYRDAGGRTSQRIVWPFALGFFEEARVLAAWCERRNEVRHFRTDRIASLDTLAERYPRRRQDLLKAWRYNEGIRTPRV